MLPIPSKIFVRFPDFFQKSISQLYYMSNFNLRGLFPWQIDICMYVVTITRVDVGDGLLPQCMYAYVPDITDRQNLTDRSTDPCQ